MDKNIIIGNWKMNLRIKSAQNLIKNINTKISDKDNKYNKIIVCPSSPHLYVVSQKLIKNIFLGCQNIFWEDEGSYTGEISVKMIKDIGCKYSIVGHSERRIILGETNQMVNKKINICQQNNIIPILCVGEDINQRKNNQTNNFLKKQIITAFNDINVSIFKEIIIAYEPIWAIGTKNPAKPEDADNAAKFIKNVLYKIKKVNKEDIKVLYGGSVDGKNIRKYTLMKNISGVLIGGESIKAEGFLNIIKNSYK